MGRLVSQIAPATGCLVTFLFAMLGGGALISPATAGTIYNIHLYSDNEPDYTTLESFLQTATGIWSDPQDKAIAIWRWALRNHRQTHATKEDGRGLWDPILFYNSYANSYCGYMAGFLQTFYEGMGGDWRGGYVELGDHTVSQASWDAGQTWHLFDTSMGIYCLRHDGVVASCQDIQSAHSCELSQALGAPGNEPGHYYLYHFAPECGTNPVNPQHAGDLGFPWGYRQASDNPVAYERTLRNGADSYISGFDDETSYTHVRNGFTYRLNLRPWQVYTRHWEHLGETEDYYRANTYGEDPDDTTPPSHMRGNGIWEFTPDLTTTAYRQVMYSESGTVHRTEAGTAGPNIHPLAPDAAAELIFKVDGANIITSARVHLTGRCDTAGDALTVSISRDAGLNWQQVWQAPTGGNFATDLPLSAGLLGGAWEYLVRVGMRAQGDRTHSGIDELEITTVTQVSTYTLPRLVRGANRIHFYLGEQVESNLLYPPLHQERYKNTAVSYDNVTSGDSGDVFYSAVLSPTRGNTPAHVTWRFETPTDIVGLYYGGSFHSRYEDATDYVRLMHSSDGQQYLEDERYVSRGNRINGRVFADIDQLPAGTRSIWLNYEFMCQHDNAWNSTGIQDALMRVEYAPRDAGHQPVEVTYCWIEHRHDQDVTRQHTQLIQNPEAIYTIDVGGYRDPTMQWIRINLAGYGPQGSSTAYGYSDGQDVGPGAGYDKKRSRFSWLDNVAFQKPYTVNRPADSVNPDQEGQELTNGCIVPPTDLNSYIDTQVQSALWAGDQNVVVTVDLGGPRTVAAVRISTHQPDATYCHAQMVQVDLSSDGSNYSTLGTIHHDDIWSPPGDYMRWGFEDSPEFAELPAGGRLAFSFWLVPGDLATGRYLRCTFTPQTGRGLGISEIQAFSSISVEDWPDKEVDIDGASSLGVENPPPGQENGGGLPQPERLLVCVPNPFNASTDVIYRVRQGSRVRLGIYDVSGRRVRQLVPGAYQRAGEYRLSWDARDDQGVGVASGLYLCLLKTEHVYEVTRVVLVK